jgi:hypothetical protein
MWDLWLPTFDNRLRWLVIAYGLALLAWMGTEANAMLTVALLGCCGACLIATLQVTQQVGGRALRWQMWLPGAVWLGALLGAGCSLFTAALMFFKTAWHSHLFPDFPVEMMVAVLARAPLWALAGALGLLAGALLLVALRPQAER